MPPSAPQPRPKNAHVIAWPSRVKTDAPQIHIPRGRPKAALAWPEQPQFYHPNYFDTVSHAQHQYSQDAPDIWYSFPSPNLLPVSRRKHRLHLNTMANLLLDVLQTRTQSAFSCRPITMLGTRSGTPFAKMIAGGRLTKSWDWPSLRTSTWSSSAAISSTTTSPLEKPCTKSCAPFEKIASE